MQGANTLHTTHYTAAVMTSTPQGYIQHGYVTAVPTFLRIQEKYFKQTLNT